MAHGTRREHVGELEFELAGGSLAELFAQAAALLAAEEHAGDEQPAVEASPLARESGTRADEGDGLPGEVVRRAEAPPADAAAAGGYAEAAGPDRPPAAVVRLEAADTATLLVDWVNELVYLTEARDALFPTADVLETDGRSLHAELRPVAAPVRHAVKAATLHGAVVERTDDGFAARVVVDV
jgi:SHS2 domain-containing protein